MSDIVISEIKRDYVRNLIAEGKRPDGRRFDELRPLKVWTNIISQAEGSARVKLGDTEVWVGVKMAIGTPYPDTPTSGNLTTSAELVPIASPDFETGPPSPEAIELSRVVDRGIREAKTINMEKLCITPGEKVWTMYIDMHIVDYDGNLFDACSAACLAALLTTKVPASKHGVGEDFPLPVDHYPIMTTAMKIGKGIVYDPGLIEDQVGGPRLSTSTDENGNVRAMQKGLEGSLTRDEVLEAVRTSQRLGRELREELFRQVGFTPPGKAAEAAAPAA